jgi:hypothetical protein
MNTLGPLFDRILAIKLLADPTEFLGIKIFRDENNNFFISQPSKIDAMATTFNINFNTFNPTYIPFKTDTDIDYHADRPMLKEAMLPKEQRTSTLIGQLAWIAMMTRVDILAYVRHLQQHNHHIQIQHRQAAMQILNYLFTTMHFQRRFEARPNHAKRIQVFSDAAFATKHNAKSQTGIAVFYHGIPIKCSATVQRAIALDSSEAEYAAMASSEQASTTINNIISFLENANPSIKEMIIDNESCQMIAQNKHTIKRARHWNVKYHFTRQRVQTNHTFLTPVPSKENVADFFTKRFGRPSFEVFRNIFIKPHFVGPTKYIASHPHKIKLATALKAWTTYN